MKKTFSLALAFMMCLSLCVSANAIEEIPALENEGFVWGLDENGNKVKIICDEIDDGVLDIRGNIIPNSPRIVEDTMFTMYLNAMKYSLYTTGGKSFVKSDLTGGYLKIYGILESENDYGQVGLVYYDDGFYVAYDYLTDVDCGEYFTFYYPQSSFSRYYYYYGYAQNPYSGSGSYAGRVHYINAER